MTRTQESSTTIPWAERMLQTLDELAAAEQASLRGRLSALGLPAAIVPRVEADVSLALIGVRLAAQRWLPRPPIQTSVEENSFKQALQDAVASRVTEVVTAHTERLRVVAARTQGQLAAWNAQRAIVTDDRPTPAQRALLTDTPPVDRDSWQRIDLGGGKFRIEHNLWPDDRDARGQE